MRHLLARLVAVLGVGAVASQAGHLVVYEIQFGSAAAALQSEGAHAYFPALAKASLGLTTVAALAGLLVVGAARLASGRPVRTTSSPAFMPLLSILFTFQLAVFIAQETIEALVAGTPPPHGVALLFLGTMGQLPVAALAAIAIKWLAARLEFAVVVLRRQLSLTAVISLPEIVSQPRLRPIPQTALAEASPKSFVKRGPPRHLLS